MLQLFASCTLLYFFRSTNIFGKYEDTVHDPVSDGFLPKCTSSLSLSAFPHSFLLTLCCPVRHTHSFSMISFVPFLFHLSLWASSLPPASNWPTLYELQPKMMSLIIWVEIMWLSFSLRVSAGPCVQAHISLCVRALDCVCDGALYWCPHYHFQTRVENQHVGHLLVKLLTHCCFYRERTNIKPLLFYSWQKQSTGHSFLLSTTLVSPYWTKKIGEREMRTVEMRQINYILM